VISCLIEEQNANVLVDALSLFKLIDIEAVREVDTFCYAEIYDIHQEKYPAFLLPEAPGAVYHSFCHHCHGSSTKNHFPGKQSLLLRQFLKTRKIWY